MSHFHLTLVGFPTLQKNNTFLHFQRNKTWALLAYLAVTGEAWARVSLATLLWPEAPQPKALGLLRNVLTDLRQHTGPALVQETGKTLRLEKATLKCDLLKFREIITRAQNASFPLEEPPPDLCEVEKALPLVHEDFMVGFSVSKSLPFDEWQAQQSQHLQHEKVWALAYLVTGYRREQDYEKALHFARQWALLDPQDGRVYQALGVLYTLTGQTELARRQLEMLRDLGRDTPDDFLFSGAPQNGHERLPEIPRLQPLEREAQPRIPVQTLPNSARPLRPGARIAPTQDTTAQAEAPPPLHHLPYETTAFVPRPADLKALLTRLHDPACRLLTLLGWGGVGKSRLARETARHLTRTVPALFPDGIFYFSLTRLHTPEELPLALAFSLELPRPKEATPSLAITCFFQHKKSLLILDNAEHLTHDLAFLTELLEATSALKILVTSRSRLKLPEAWGLALKGLPYPSLEAPVTHLADTLQYGAVQLFVQRAQQVQEDFVLTSQNVATVLRICAAVEGLPLGLELAAQHLPAFACTETLVACFENPTWLTSQDSPRSLAAVFERSWTLLSPEEQGALAQLSGFSGPFSLPGAYALEVSKVALLRLCDQSLVQRTTETTYELHPLIRQFAAQKLAQHVQAFERTQARLHQYYLEQLIEQLPQLKGSGQPLALEALKREFPCLLKAWQWALQEATWPLLGQALEPFARFLEARHLYAEGYQALTLAKALCPQEGPEAQRLFGYALNWLGRFSLQLGKVTEAEQHLTQSLALAHELEDAQVLAFSLSNMGSLEAARGEIARAHNYAQQSLALYTRLEDVFEVGRVLNNLGTCLKILGNLAQAQTYYEQSLAISLKTGDIRAAAIRLTNLGNLATVQGAYGRAYALFAQARGLYALNKDEEGEAICLTNLGQLAAQQGAQEEACHLYTESLTKARQLGLPSLIRTTLTGLGLCLLELGKKEAAYEALREAWVLNLDLQVYPEALTLLVHLAQLFLTCEAPVHQGQRAAQARQMLAFVLNHPKRSEEAQQRAQALWRQFALEEREASTADSPSLLSESAWAELRHLLTSQALVCA